MFLTHIGSHVINMQSILPPTSSPEPDLDAQERIQLAAKVIHGVHWFYWVAALSAINTIISASGIEYSFALGLAFTQLIDAFSAQIVGPGRYAVIVVELMIAGVFVVFGLLGTRYQLWAIVAGTVLYVMDGLLLLGLMALGGATLIIGLLIHGWATYQLISGMIACRRFNQLRFSPGPPSPDVMSTMGQH